jgi:hypothetical protein
MINTSLVEKLIAIKSHKELAKTLDIHMISK